MIGTFLAGWALNLGATAVAFLLLFLAAGLGNRLWRLLAPPGADSLEEGVLSLALGLGTVPLLVLALGTAGLLGPLPLAALLAGTAALAVPAMRALLRPGLTVLVQSADRSHLLLTGGATTLIWLLALSPPLFYDALVYHLALPNLFLLRGGTGPLPSVIYSHFPLGSELLSVTAIAAFGGRFEAALVLNAAMLPLAAAGSGLIARRLAGPRAGWIAAALFLVTPMPLMLARYATAEPMLAVFVVLTIFCLLLSLEEEGTRWTRLAGIFGGMAYGAKYLGGLQAILLPAALLAVRRLLGAPATAPSTARRLGVFGLAAALPMLPWWLRNLAETGNPVYPALHGLLGSGGWSALQARTFAADAKAAATMIGSWQDLLALPVDLLLLRRDFGAAPAVTLLGPLAVVALVVLGRERDWRGRFLAAGVGGLFLVWLATFWMARFLLPALALGAAAAGALAARGEGRPARRGQTIVLLGLAALNVGVLLAAGPTRRALPPALGLRDRDSYLAANLRAHPVVRRMNATLDSAARVLAVGEMRVAYLRRDHLYSTALDRPALALLAGEPPAPATLERNLARQEITHVLVNLREWKTIEAGYPPAVISPAVREAFFTVLRSSGRLLEGADGIYLYELSGLEGRAPAAE